MCCFQFFSFHLLLLLATTDYMNERAQVFFKNQIFNYN